jgi:hypothetical protein
VQVGSRIRALRDEFFVVRFAPLSDADDGHAKSAAEDDAKLISCEFFDTRSGFLRMCQGNNYQVGAAEVSRYRISPPMSCHRPLLRFQPSW